MMAKQNNYQMQGAFSKMDDDIGKPCMELLALAGGRHSFR